MSNQPATVRHHAAASQAAVWDVLADGWTYASWVVGASRVRDVDANWPQVGSRLHHSFGVWPLVINDRTEVLESEPGSRLLLKARGWPTGEATVNITIAGLGPRESLLSIEEDATAGPALAIPQSIRQTLTVPRNKEALRRLGLLAAGRQI
ncbi:MAG TPA: SRPBCC family protein [Propionibacteriaceae bacterium]|nr:SRPBCC family protein [Propionibacteriaceae bacterium]